MSAQERGASRRLPKGQMPAWLREEMQRQFRVIAWHRLRSRRTGTGWPEIQVMQVDQSAKTDSGPSA